MKRIKLTFIIFITFMLNLTLAKNTLSHYRSSQRNINTIHKMSDAISMDIIIIIAIVFISLIILIYIWKLRNDKKIALEKNNFKNKLNELLHNNILLNEHYQILINDIPKKDLYYLSKDLDKFINEKNEKDLLYDELRTNKIFKQTFLDDIKNNLYTETLFNLKEKVRMYILIDKYGNELADTLYNKKIFIGMTEDMLRDSLGEPTKIENEVLKTKIKTIYIYGNKTSGDVYIFTNGKLERYKDR